MRRGLLAAAILLILGGIAARWWGLGDLSLWMDEGYTQWLTTLSPAELIRVIRSDFTPPLYFLIMAGWTNLFGDSEFALRSWSALCASAAVVAVVAVAWKTTRHLPATLFATGLFAYSCIQVQWAQTARCYSTAALVFVICVWLLIRYIESARRVWLIGFALCAAVLVYQHNVMWLFLAGLNLGALVWPGRLNFTQRFAAMFVADAIVGICFLPWLSGFLQQLRSVDAAYFTERPTIYDLTTNIVQQIGVDLPRLWSVSHSYLGTTDAVHGIYRLALFAAAIVLPIAAVIRQDKVIRARLLALLAFAAVPLALGFVYSLFRTSVWVDKTFIPSSTLLPIVLAASIATGWRPMVRVACGGVLVAIALASALTSIDYVRNRPVEDWRSATAWVPRQGSNGLSAVFVGGAGEMLYRYYTQRLDLPTVDVTGLPHGYFETDPPVVMTRVLRPQQLEPLRRFMAQPQTHRIALIQTYLQWSDPNRLAQSCLDNEWRLVDTIDCGEVTGRLYEKPLKWSGLSQVERVVPNPREPR